MRILLLLIFLSGFSFAQKSNIFPADQYSYLGGEVGFYRDFQKILLAKNLKPCENKKELFRAFIIVNADETATLYDDDQFPVELSKCSKDLAKLVIPEMTGWIAAKIKDRKETAVASYYIYPDAFFANYKEGYSTEDSMERPVFEGGIDAFRKEVMKRADLSGFYVKGKGKVTLIIKFLINQKGEMENVTLEGTSGLKEYDEMLISSVKSIKKKWIPAKIYGYPVRYRFRLPISFTNN